MSELKAYRPRELVMQGRHNELIYLKSEADKLIAEKDKEIARLDDLAHAHNIELLRKENLIAELKKKINEAQTELELWRDGSIISEAHQKELDGKQHSDYKRCLAMAEWCDAEADVADADGDYEDMRWYQKWHKRWLAIAEKLKESRR